MKKMVTFFMIVISCLIGSSCSLFKTYIPKYSNFENEVKYQEFISEFNEISLEFSNKFKDELNDFEYVCKDICKNKIVKKQTNGSKTVIYNKSDIHNTKFIEVKADIDNEIIYSYDQSFVDEEYIDGSNVNSEKEILEYITIKDDETYKIYDTNKVYKPYYRTFEKEYNYRKNELFYNINSAFTDGDFIGYNVKYYIDDNVYTIHHTNDNITEDERFEMVYQYIIFEDKIECFVYEEKYLIFEDGSKIQENELLVKKYYSFKFKDISIKKIKFKDYLLIEN